MAPITACAIAWLPIPMKKYGEDRQLDESPPATAEHAGRKRRPGVSVCPRLFVSRSKQSAYVQFSAFS